MTKTPEPKYPPMVKDHLETAKRVMEKVLKDKESAQKFLQQTGIYDADGNLTEHYR
ncbi:MAG: hypothetical protein KF858_11810 [Candidatus Sumerlaeia bacterium]|nr:hypothetical protein [Candidatus Sumerlaeia bacterium]